MTAALRARDIGAVFRLYRRLTGLSQTELSALVQIPQPRIGLIESGRYHVKSLETFERIASGLAIPPPTAWVSPHRHQTSNSRRISAAAVRRDALQWTTSVGGPSDETSTVTARS